MSEINVRKITGTTVSFLMWIIAVYFLFPRILNALPYEAVDTLEWRFHPQYVSGYDTFIIFAAIWVMVAAGVIDSILNNRVALGLLASFNIPLVLAIPVIILAFIHPVNEHIFWCVLYVTVILGIYWTFRKIIANNHPSGQKLIPFIKDIKTGGGVPGGHASDHYTVFVFSLFLIALQMTLIISMIIYAVNNWQEFLP